MKFEGQQNIIPENLHIFPKCDKLRSTLIRTPKNTMPKVKCASGLKGWHASYTRACSVIGNAYGVNFDYIVEMNFVVYINGPIPSHYIRKDKYVI